MNRSIYGFLLAFCIGYITNDTIYNPMFSSVISSVHAEVTDTENTEDTIDIEDIDIEELYKALNFTTAVRNIVEDCIVENNRIRCWKD